MSLFESITRSKLKDCFEQDTSLVFVVKEGEVGKAVGKKAANVKKLELKLNKKIKIIEYSPNLLDFVKNVIHPFKLQDVIDEEGTVTMTAIDSNTRGMLIGRNAQNLRQYETIVKRFFDIKELKVA